MKFEDRDEAEMANSQLQGEERKQIITENRQGKLQPDLHSEKKGCGKSAAKRWSCRNSGKNRPG
jgi:hypothetical protein